MIKALLGAIILVAIIIGIIKAFPVLGIALAVVAAGIIVYLIIKFVNKKKKNDVLSVKLEQEKTEKKALFSKQEQEKIEREENRKRFLENKVKTFNSELVGIL